MKQEVKIGQTDYTVLIKIRDTAGAAKTSLTNASAGIDVSYVRVETDNDITITAGAVVALATPALTDPHLDWGFLEVDATNQPGIYRLDIADGVFATGAWSSVVTLIATGIDPVSMEFVLVPESPYTGVNTSMWLGTACATPTVAGVPEVDVTHWLGTASAVPTQAGVPEVDVTYWKGAAAPDLHTPAELATAVWQDAVAGDFSVASSVGKALYIANIVPGASGGHMISGSNAGTTTLGALTITGITTHTGATVHTGNVSMLAGLTVSNTTVNGPAIEATGNGTGSGMYIVGGATGNGIHALSGNGATGDGIKAESIATEGSGLRAEGSGIGPGLMAISGVGVTGNGITAVSLATNGLGIYAGGAGTGAGLYAVSGAGATGSGIYVLSQATNGDGMTITGVGTGNGLTVVSGAGAFGNGVAATSLATNGNGISILGNGAGAGISSYGGLTGNGLTSVGGGTSGEGIYAKAAGTGNGLDCHGGGVAGEGIHAEADNDGDGINTIGVAAGHVDLRADITGDITGTLATVTTYTGNTVQTGDSFARIGAAGAGLTAIGDVRIANQVKKNTALAGFPFVMTDAVNHAPSAALAVTATRSIDGGAFAACANAVVEISNGWYYINLAATDLNGNTIALRFTAAASDDLNITIVTQAQA
jgi:hypothetical protein